MSTRFQILSVWLFNQVGPLNVDGSSLSIQTCSASSLWSPLVFSQASPYPPTHKKTRTMGTFLRVYWLLLCPDIFKLWSRANKESGFVTTAFLSLQSGKVVLLRGARLSHTAQTPSVRASPGRRSRGSQAHGHLYSMCFGPSRKQQCPLCCLEIRNGLSIRVNRNLEFTKENQI